MHSSVRHISLARVPCKKFLKLQVSRGKKMQNILKNSKDSALTVPDNLSAWDGRAVWREEGNASVTVFFFFLLATWKDILHLAHWMLSLLLPQNCSGTVCRRDGTLPCSRTCAASDSHWFYTFCTWMADSYVGRERNSQRHHTGSTKKKRE